MHYIGSSIPIKAIILQGKMIENDNSIEKALQIVPISHMDPTNIVANVATPYAAQHTRVSS